MVMVMVMLMVMVMVMAYWSEDTLMYLEGVCKRWRRRG